MADPELTFLGTGTSIGVPVIGCDCDVCLSDDPKNTRLRSSILIKSDHGTLVVDTGPDFRYQCLREQITKLDAAIFTHAHSDHIMGFDDLRRFTVGKEARIDIHANQETIDRLQSAFHYAFNGENHYYGYLKPVPHVVTGLFQTCGWDITPLSVTHGKVDTIGYLFSDQLAYIPDAKTISDEALERIQNVPILIVDGLQMKNHNTHLSIPEAVEIAQQVNAGQTWLTHCSCRVNYQEIEPTLPDNIRIAWDGLKLSLNR